MVYVDYLSRRVGYWVVIGSMYRSRTNIALRCCEELFSNGKKPGEAEDAGLWEFRIKV